MTADVGCRVGAGTDAGTTSAAASPHAARARLSTPPRRQRQPTRPLSSTHVEERREVVVAVLAAADDAQEDVDLCVVVPRYCGRERDHGRAGGAGKTDNRKNKPAYFGGREQLQRLLRCGGGRHYYAAMATRAARLPARPLCRCLKGRLAARGARALLLHRVRRFACSRALSVYAHLLRCDAGSIGAFDGLWLRLRVACGAELRSAARFGLAARLAKKLGPRQKHESVRPLL